MLGRNFDLPLSYAVGGRGLRHRHVRRFLIGAFRVLVRRHRGFHPVEDDAVHHQQEQNAQPGVGVVVHHDVVHVGDLLGAQLGAALGDFAFVFAGQEEEAFQLRVVAEQLQAQRVGGADQQPHRRQHGHPDVLGALHLNQHHGAQHQRHGGQHLVGYAEQRPQALHAAERIHHSLIQQVAPQPDAAGGADDAGHQRVGFLQERHEVAEQILQHKAAGAGAGVQRGQDEQRLEQNAEVIPEAHVGARNDLVEHVGDAHRQRWRAAGAVQHRRFADVGGGLQDLFRADDEAPGADRRRRMHGHVLQRSHDHRRVFGAQAVQIRHGDAQRRRRGVHGEVQARLDDGSRHQRHDGDEGLHQHRAVADKARVGLIGQQLRRGAGGDQRVEAGDRTAGDGDEQEREQRAFPHRAGAVDELGHRRHFQLGIEDHDADRQPDDHADFQEGGQVVARRQDQPHRQQSGDERVADQREGDGGVFKGQRRAPVRVVRHHAAEPDGGHQQHDADD